MDDSTLCGTKRKRHERPQQDLGAKISGKLHHDIKRIKKAAKKAKTFETQKVIKKLKDLRKENEKLQEIAEAESILEAVKALNSESIAKAALKTKINKVRILREYSHLQEAMSKELVDGLEPVTPGSPSAKIQSRLLSSKILAGEIALVVTGLESLLQPSDVDVSYTAAQGDDDGLIHRAKKSKKVAGFETQEESVLDWPQAGKKSQKEEGSPGEKQMAGEDTEDARQAILDDEDQVEDGWESGSISGGEEENDVAESDGGNNDLEASPHPTKPSLKSQPTAGMKKSGIQSTFLPSLSVGFVRGSDDSDFSDSDAKVADIEIKKNRRGQRARRAIWEKKYGKNANHKQKEVAKGDAQGRFQTRAKVIPRQPPTGRQHEPELSVREKPIHPSWEAKRKLKERESARIVASQGQKITF